MSKKAAKAGFLGLRLGALAGIFVIAPKGAKQKREDAKKAVAQGRKLAEKHLKEVYEDLNNQVEELVKKTQDMAIISDWFAKTMFSCGSKVSRFWPWIIKPFGIIGCCNLPRYAAETRCFLFFILRFRLLPLLLESPGFPGKILFMWGKIFPMTPGYTPSTFWS